MKYDNPNRKPTVHCRMCRPATTLPALLLMVAYSYPRFVQSETYRTEFQWEQKGIFILFDSGYILVFSCFTMCSAYTLFLLYSTPICPTDLAIFIPFNLHGSWVEQGKHFIKWNRNNDNNSNNRIVAFLELFHGEKTIWCRLRMKIFR